MMGEERRWEVKKGSRDFPGDPVTKTPCFQCMGPGVRSLVRELDPTCCNQEFALLQLKTKEELARGNKDQRFFVWQLRLAQPNK